MMGRRERGFKRKKKSGGSPVGVTTVTSSTTRGAPRTISVTSRESATPVLPAAPAKVDCSSRGKVGSEGKAAGAANSPRFWPVVGSSVV